MLILKPLTGGKILACQDCKRRKVKCDYRKPTCMRCEKAEIACKGYHRHTKFNNKTPGELSTTSPLKGRSKQKIPSRAPLPGNRFDADLQYLTSQIHNPTGPSTQFRLQALDLLKELYLPRPSQADIRRSATFSWLPNICALAGESRALNHALLAFCFIQVAVTKTGSAGIDEALQVYSDALQKLQVELDEDGAGQSDEILAAISVLSTCEIFACPTDNAWHAHAQGLSKILSIRSVMNSPTPIWQSFCMRIRVVLLIEALVNRSAHSTRMPSQCPQLVFASNGYESIHDLIDVAWDVPVLLEASDKLIASHARPHTHSFDHSHIDNSTVQEKHWREDLFTPSLIVIEKLQTYHQKQFAQQRGKPLYWAEPSSVHNPADDPYNGNKLFPFALHFDSLDTASRVVLWWGMMLQVLCGVLDLHQHFYVNNSSSVSLPSLTPSKHLPSASPSQDEGEPVLNARFPTIASVIDEANKLARYLCQAVEYCHKIENGTIGPQMTTYSQWISKVYFRKFHYERELDWCLNIKNMRGPGFRNGIEVMGLGNALLERI